ncbi:hypothetical protein P879_06905 [Paragonimus westermani]|uniref:Uncharacterized protein n=1 Tax=Paragonimus westermani TaxID=34504 RepID=A0A8T0DY06_9TREM|nr:hypothetical protein P879_06905 [Paragonimus westermani]
MSPNRCTAFPNVSTGDNGGVKGENVYYWCSWCAEFASATCNALVKIREEIHGPRLDIFALRHQAFPQSKESASNLLKCSVSAVEEQQLPHEKLKNITLLKYLIIYPVFYLREDKLFETYRGEFS